MTTYRCVQCAHDSDCSGATPMCETVLGRCVQCLPVTGGATDAGTGCPAGQTCNPQSLTCR
jgi:hypothetical protein